MLNEYPLGLNTTANKLQMKKNIMQSIPYPNDTSYNISHFYKDYKIWQIFSAQN